VRERSLHNRDPGTRSAHFPWAAVVVRPPPAGAGHRRSFPPSVERATCVPSAPPPAWRSGTDRTAETRQRKRRRMWWWRAALKGYTRQSPRVRIVLVRALDSDYPGVSTVAASLFPLLLRVAGTAATCPPPKPADRPADRQQQQQQQQQQARFSFRSREMPSSRLTPRVGVQCCASNGNFVCFAASLMGTATYVVSQ
jgi:hypothetical protein